MAGDITFVNRSVNFNNPRENVTDDPNMSKLFMAFRDFGFPPLYGERKTSVTADVLIAGFVFAAVITALSFYVVLPGYPRKQRLSAFLRFTISILIGTFIMVCNFGQEWEVSEIEARVPYKAGVGFELEHAHLGLHIGLRSINVTMRAGDRKNEYRVPIGNGQVEEINYNERFTFGWAQGRAFFGPFASDFNQEFREAQFTGLPLPILWIAEYFTLDGEGIRWGRHYRQGGWYAHIMLWLAFPMWILSNILFFMVIRFGAYFLMMTGGSLILGNIIFAGIRNFLPLKIPFENESGEVIHLMPKFGWCFGLCLFTGLLCLVLGLIILYMDGRYPDGTAKFFDIDVLQDSEEYYTVIKDKENGKTDEAKADGEIKESKDKTTSDKLTEQKDEVEMKNMPDREADDDSGHPDYPDEQDDIYANAAAIREQENGHQVAQFRKRAFSKRFDKVKSTTKAPKPHPRQAV